MSNAVSNYLFDLNLIRLDHELINEGWTLYFAIDFFQLYKFSFPFNTYINELLINNPSKDFKTKIAEEQASLSLIFEGLKDCPSPVILNPHFLELQEFLELTYDNTIINKLDSKMLNKWKDKIFTEKDLVLINYIDGYLKNKNPKKKLDESKVKDVILLVKENFKDYLFYLSGWIRNGIEKVSKLINEKKLLTFSLSFPSYSDKLIEFYETVNFKESFWFKMFESFRPGKTIGNYRDSVSIETIMWLNKCFEKEDEKKRILLISDAFSMSLVLNCDLHIHKYPQFKDLIFEKLYQDNIPAQISFGNREMRILRNYNNFFLYLIFSGKNITDTLKNVNDEMDKVINKLKALGFLEIFGDCKRYELKDRLIVEINSENICKICKYYNSCKLKEHFEDIDKQNQILEYRDNLKLYMQNNQYIDSFVQTINIESNNVLAKMIDFIKNPNNGIKKEIENESDRIINTIERFEDEKIGLIKQVIENNPPPGIINELKGKISWISNITQFRVEFSNPNIDELYKKVTNSRIEEGVKSRKMFKEILDLAFSQFDKRENESDLFLSLLFYTFKKYEYAEKFIKDALYRQNLINKNEYLYILSLILEQIGVNSKNEIQKFKCFIDALKIIDSLIENSNKKRAKYYHIKGRIIAHVVRFCKIINQFELKDAEKCFEEGLKHVDIWDRSLKATLYNNLAYLEYLKAEKTKIYTKIGFKKIVDLFEKIESVAKFEKKEWLPVFYDTKAMIKYYESKLISDINGKRILLNQGLELLIEAKKEAKIKYTFDWAIKSFNKSIKKIKKESENIGNNKR